MWVDVVYHALVNAVLMDALDAVTRAKVRVRDNAETRVVHVKVVVLLDVLIAVRGGVRDVLIHAMDALEHVLRVANRARLDVLLAVLVDAHLHVQEDALEHVLVVAVVVIHATHRVLMRVGLIVHQLVTVHAH